jgi:hypothetical protein
MIPSQSHVAATAFSIWFLGNKKRRLILLLTPDKDLALQRSRGLRYNISDSILDREI